MRLLPILFFRNGCDRVNETNDDVQGEEAEIGTNVEDDVRSCLCIRVRRMWRVEVADGSEYECSFGALVCWVVEWCVQCDGLHRDWGSRALGPLRRLDG